MFGCCSSSTAWWVRPRRTSRCAADQLPNADYSLPNGRCYPVVEARRLSILTVFLDPSLRTARISVAGACHARTAAPPASGLVARYRRMVRRGGAPPDEQAVLLLHQWPARQP